MAQAVSLSLSTVAWEKKFRGLRRSQIEPFITGALNATAFSVAKAERADVLGSGLNFKSNTANFLSSHRVIRANHYVVDMAAYVMPRGSDLGRRGKGETILADHQKPKTITFKGADDAARLGIKKTLLAIPAEVERGGQGRVPARLKPSKLETKGRRERGRGKKRRGPFGSYPFFKFKGSNKVGLFFRETKGGDLKLGFVLQEQARLKTGPLNFHGVALAVALTEFPRKMKRAFGRIRGF